MKSAALQIAPVLRVRWSRVVFMHYRLPPALLRAALPPGFELEVYDGSGWLSIVAVTMRRFRTCGLRPLWCWFFPPLGEQRFLNVRTYANYGGHSGAFFLFGWLSRPWHLPLWQEPFGLSCAFAKIAYGHRHETGKFTGTVQGTTGALEYEVAYDSSKRFERCQPGALAEFTLERYNGFYWHRGVALVFQTRHAPWRAVPVEAKARNVSLLRARWEWLSEAHLEAAHYSPGLEDVELTGARKLEGVKRRRTHRACSAFYTMP
ncbi:MAG TPA: DUF2071 domain-containing protein [Candidatus Binatia bacterium]|jgi:uncharacterized protein YqjF (DUF2071 family)|nr:DUF2071 domain-containing protein [Candidatus Binatia bacterium]